MSGQYSNCESYVKLMRSLYRSPTKSTTSDSNNKNLNELLKCLSHREDAHKCLVCDLNYRNINGQTWTISLSDKNLEAKFIESVRDSFLYQHIEKTNSPTGKSDHNLITFEFHTLTTQNRKKNTTLRGLIVMP